VTATLFGSSAGASGWAAVKCLFMAGLSGIN
jgi:hypothetical protein